MADSEKQQTSNPQPSSYKPSSRNAIGLLILSVIVMIAIAYVFYKSREKNINEAQPTKTATPSNTLSPNKDPSYIAADIVKNSSKLSFPAILTSVDISLDQLPPELKPFVLPKASSTRIEKLTYNEQSSGFRITFGMLSPIEATNEQFLNQLSGWKLLVGSRAGLAALIEFKNSKYSARIVQKSSLDETSNTITIQIK